MNEIKNERAVIQPKLTIKMNVARLDINANGTKIYCVGKFFILKQEKINKVMCNIHM